MIKQVIFALLCSSTLMAQQPTASQQQIAKVMSTPVLQQAGVSYTAGDVLENLFKNDESLKTILQRDYEYLAMYINSQKFFNHVRWFSNNLVLDSNDVPDVDSQALIDEALAWAAERGQQTANPQSALAQGGLEITVRARLLSLQKEFFSTQELRTHFHRSIPEYAGTLKISWIRLPLFNSKTGAALGEDERIARYGLLDKVAQKLNESSITWNEAVTAYCKDPITKERNGGVGYIKRSDTKFEESFRRQLFDDLGFKRIENTILRGPIIGESWVYLAQIESVIMKGVVELQLFKNEVQRSLSNYKLHAKLSELTASVNRSILIPLTL
ncbi:MAG: hypothetical protein H8E25_08890 [Planctomycetes bacterium]|nr:hypothetical protein [Planctomycetota bacterium]